MKLESFEINKKSHKCGYIFNHKGNTVTLMKLSNNLYFFVNSNNKEVILEFERDNYLLYNVIGKLYNSVIKKSFLETYNYEFLNHFYFLLVCDNKIKWENDVNNYFELYKEKDKYIMKFVSDLNNFIIRLDDKYGPFISPFLNLLFDLDKVLENNHQITMDEYLNEKKYVKK